MHFLVILLITVLVAIVVYFIFERGLKRIVGKTRTNLDDKIVAAVRIPLLATVLLVGVRLGVKGIRGIYEYQEIFDNGVVAGLALVWGFGGIRVLSVLVAYLGRKTKHARQLLLLFDNLVKILVWSVVLMLVLSAFGVDITPLLASAGIAGLAVGLGAQETLSNIFSGVAIILDKPYKICDYIIVEWAGDRGSLRGEVLDIGMRSTKIRTRDNVYLTIPNSVMASSVIVNETGKATPLRLRVKVGVGYGSDVTKLEQVLLKAVWEVDNGKENILGGGKTIRQAQGRGFEPKVRFREFGESALIFELLVWIREPELKGKMVHYLNKAVLEALRREKIEIPFPQRDVHISK